MARMEGKLVEPKKTAKAEKRKHSAGDDSDDEVPPKTVIVDEDAMRRIRGEKPKATTRRPHEPDELEVEAKKPRKSEITKTEEVETLAQKNALKRKTLEKDGCKTLEKRPKRENDNNDTDDEEDNDLREPTSAELKASTQPDNKKAVVTVRQRKKALHEERLKAQKSQSLGKEKQRNEQYLRKWKYERADWKFEKLRQISIAQSAFDEQIIVDEVWPLALEYLSSSKGAAKQKLIELGEAVIDNLDKTFEERAGNDKTQAVVNSSRYQRARQLLQSFN